MTEKSHILIPKDIAEGIAAAMAAFGVSQIVLRMF